MVFRVFRARETIGGNIVLALIATTWLAFGCGESTADDDGNAGEGAEGGSTASGAGGRSGSGGRGGTSGQGGGGSSGSPTSGGNAGSLIGGGTSGRAGASGGGGRGGSDAQGGSSNEGGSDEVAGAGGEGDSGGSGGSGGATEECQGDVTITSDADLTTFAARRCSVLDGTLAIQSGTLIDLDALAPSPLRLIRGGLQINSNLALTSIVGLAGLERITGSLGVTNNPSLPDLSGLEELDQIGTEGLYDTLVLQGNTALTSVAAIGASDDDLLEIRLSLVVTGNEALTSLRGVDGLVGPSNITIANNPELTEIGGLAELEAAGNLTIASNSGLVTCDFPALEVIDVMTLTSNTSLASVALPGLTTVQQYLTIAENPVLTTLGSLDALESAFAMIIAGNPMLPQCFVDELDARLDACGEGCGGNDDTATCD